MTMNTQRGIPYERDPDAVLRRVRQQRDAERTKVRATMRAKGKMLDQIETCYRQHKPPQVRFADEMRVCP